MPSPRQILSRTLLLAALWFPAACSMRSLDRLSVASGPTPSADAQRADAVVLPPFDGGEDLPARDLASPSADAAEGPTADRGPPARKVFLVVRSVTLTAADTAL